MPGSRLQGSRRRWSSRVPPRSVRDHCQRHRRGGQVHDVPRPSLPPVVRPPTGESSCRSTTVATFFKRRCLVGVKPPTGSARGAGGSRRGRAITASSNSRRVTSWNGWPISCRRRGSTGTARRLETSQGCSPRITSSGPPSRRWPSGMSASGEMPRPVGMPPATAATHAANRDLTTPPDAKGQTHGSGGGGVSAGVPGVRWRHPTLRRRPAGAGSLRT